MAITRDGKQQLTVRLDDELRAALDRRAETMDRTVGWVVRDAIRHYLGEYTADDFGG